MQDGGTVGWLPHGQWFTLAWMAAGAVLDLGCLSAFHYGSFGGPLIGIDGAAITLAVVWVVHAAVMPSLAAGGVGWFQGLRLLVLGLGFVFAGTVAALLAGLAGSFLGGGVMAAAAQLGPTNAPPSELGGPGFIFAVGLAILSGGAMAGAVLHPFLAAALPRGARIRFRWNMGAGAAAAALLPAISFLLVGMVAGGSPFLLLTLVTLAPTVALLPHLWVVGRAIRRSLDAPAP